MFIMNGNRTELINTVHVRRFAIAQKEDACLVIASYSQETNPITLARYQTFDEAVTALDDMHMAISYDEQSYRMPESTGVYKPVGRPRNGQNGCKHKGHGGS